MKHKFFTGSILIFYFSFVKGIYIGEVLKAIEKGNNKIVLEFLNIVKNVDYRDPWQKRPLIGWAAYRGNLELVKFLAERDAYLEATDKDGFTPLILAVKGEKSIIIEYLLTKNIEKEAVDNFGWTALMWAAKTNLEIVKLLVENNANVFAKDELGNTPYTISKQFNKSTIENYLSETINNILDKINQLQDYANIPKDLIPIITNYLYINYPKKKQLSDKQKKVFIKTFIFLIFKNYIIIKL